MKLIYFLLIIIPYTLYPIPLFSKGPGTSTSNFLKIGIGVRAVGMGGAFSAISDDGSAVYWNPAGLGQLKREETSFMFNRWVEGVNYGYAGYIYPISRKKDYGTVGVSLYYLTTGKIQGYDWEGTLIQKFDAHDMAGVLSYGRKITDKRLKFPDVGLYIGGNLKIINKKLALKSAFGAALDAGVLYKPRWQVADGRFQFAGVIQNVGTGLKFVRKRNPFPLNFKIGTAYKKIVFNNDLRVAFDLNIPNDNKISLNIGGEYIFWDLISLRVGYKTRDDLDSGIRFGGGLSVRDLYIDYAFVPFGVLGDTHRFSIGMKFGRVVDKVEILDREIRRHLRKGEKYFSEERLLLAYREFRNVIILDAAHNEAEGYIAKIEGMFKEIKTVRERKKRESEIAKQFEKAKKYFNDGKMIDAKKEFEMLISIDPDNRKAADYIEKINRVLEEARKQMANTLFIQGQAYYDKKMYEEAIRNWESVLNMVDDHSEAKRYIKLAEEKLREIESEKKDRELKRKEEKEKQEIKNYFEKGISLHKKRKWGEAISAFKYVLQLNPKHSRAKESLKKSEVELKKLAQANKVKAEKLYTQGLREYTAGNRKKAVELFKRAYDLDPTLTKAKKSYERTKEELRKAR